MYTGRMNTIVNAKCPYYLSEFTKSITCEGLDSTTIQIKFQTEDDKDEHIRSYCMNYKNGCPLAMGLDRCFE